MDKNAVNDIEMDGKFIADSYIYEISSPNNSGYFALQAIRSTVRLHYVQSTGYYAVHILSDTLKNGFYQYFVTLSTIPEMIERKEQIIHANTTIQDISKEKQKLELFTKLTTTTYSENLSTPKSFTVIERNNDIINFDDQFIVNTNG
ncbi:unnamed protein product [Cercopithifilaria johnstoni]|uniref:Uncharacterized protein n=1 Tax=Cercopithifilaria johnstoni TaxID=2874296 RepID=A0A8J2MHZ7_9BILA|nr:unnamed protein product [Cercopithifilaria johnstoni]